MGLNLQYILNIHYIVNHIKHGTFNICTIFFINLPTNENMMTFLEVFVCKLDNNNNNLQYTYI